MCVGLTVCCRRLYVRVYSHWQGELGPQLCLCVSHTITYVLPTCLLLLLLQDLYRMRDSSLARVSDDFYPQLPASHTSHVAICAFNSVFFAPLVQPDWDMFHSLHPRYGRHALAGSSYGTSVWLVEGRFQG